ncbi:FGGY family carbohydrate kinase [Coraliomargarita sp. SDUM461004]|uniref:FGGY family carbohydrate kinase n=1 Tax=Thalassobacterium sedimentorum TaxID=3041258 RepID=A0ABU1AHG5_9BACT|nr:FGGY family carbohydrate kinase [Coraliomargarita sp. SDUM461004]MDQ8193315.1 FGGY family carbohydrate kinase [Coraliomargarita sp. SDUM461004]
MHSLGLDSSTQSCSAIVIDIETGSIIAQASVNFGEHLPQYKAPAGFIPGAAAGEVHADPRMWLDALEQLLEALKNQCDLSKIAAISGAGQQHGSVYLNDRWLTTINSLDHSQSLANQIEPCFSRSTSPIWMDTSTGTECREITAAVGGDATVCAKSGSIAIERFTGPQIRRFYKNAPNSYAQTAHIHLVSSFLCSVLCGSNAPIDTGDGAGMNLLNIQTWDWDTDLLTATAPELNQRLPNIVDGNSTAGQISKYFVAKYGFTPGTQVTVFTGDNPSSLVGMGASQAGKLVISLGTSDTFFAAMPEVVADPQGCGHVFGNPAGGSMSLQCFVNGSLAREAVKDKFNYDWDQFTAAFANTAAGNDGQVMLPFFRPEISPRIDLDAPRLEGSEAFKHWQQADTAIRACVEGQCINMKLRSDWMQLQPEVIYLTGGASKNNAIAQVVADVFQAKVQRLAVSGSVALGAALRAASHTFGQDLHLLESRFCKPEADSTLEPIASSDTYQSATKAIAQLLSMQSQYNLNPSTS